MTTTEPAYFIRDLASGCYLPANRVATRLAEKLRKLHLNEEDLLAIKLRGFRVTLPNGEPITTGVTA